MRAATAMAILMLSGATTIPAHAASFPCEKAETASEKAICGDPALSARDEEMATAYGMAARESGTEVSQAVARKLLEKREACGDDIFCIASVQFEALDIFAVLSGQGRTPGDGRDGAGDRLTYGGKGPMKATITSRRGIGTSNAVITVANLRRDASGVCEAFNSSLPNCTENVLNTPLAAAITANCETGEFTTLYGASLRFAADEKEPDGFRIVDRVNDEPLAAAQASGFYAALEQFEALCPGKVPE